MPDPYSNPGLEVQKYIFGGCTIDFSSKNKCPFSQPYEPGTSLRDS